jgi:hypothetical protein
MAPNDATITAACMALASLFGIVEGRPDELAGNLAPDQGSSPTQPQERLPATRLGLSLQTRESSNIDLPPDPARRANRTTR